MADLNRRQTVVNTLRDAQRFVEGNDFANASIERLRVVYTTVRRSATTFLEVHDRLIGVQIPQPEFDAHEALRTNIQELITDLETQLMTRINELAQPAPQPPQPVQQPVQNPAQAQEMRYLLTQKIENTWGEFDGTLSKWKTFKDLFSAAVHEVGYIANAYKFRLLIQSLKGDAAEVLEGWQITGDNYQPAWTRLNTVFDLPHLTGTELIKRLNEVPKIEKANRKQLQHLSNVANSVTLQMQGLGYNIDHCDILFLATLEDKLDRFTRRDWDKERANNPTLEQFLTFVDRQARSAPVLFIDENKSHKPSENRKRQYDGHVQSSHAYKKFRPGNQSDFRMESKREKSKDNYKFELKCPMKDCGLQHVLYRCPKYLAYDRDAREKFVKNNRLCLNCLRPGHFVRFCTRDGCIRCEGKKHNSTLCTGNPFLSKTNTVKIQPKPENENE